MTGPQVQHGPDDGAVFSPPPAPRRRRWWLRIGLVLLLLLAAAGGVTHYIISRTDIPRRMALIKLQRETGLRISAGSVRTTWLGTTVFENLAIALPLEAEPFITVPQLRARHVNLIGVVLDLPLRLRAIEIDRPRVTVSQDAQGRWNVQEALDLLARHADVQGGPVLLPRVRVNDTHAILTDSAGRKAVLAGLTLSGDPDGQHAWDFSAALEPHITLSGRLAPNQNWRHQVAFAGQGIEALLKPWLRGIEGGIELKGSWAGQIDAGVLVGRLELERAQLPDLHAAGAASITARPDAVAIVPHAFRIASPFVPLPVRALSGVIHLRPEGIEADSLQLAVNGGAARIGGRSNWSADVAAFEAAWTNVSLPAGVVHEGSMNGALERTLRGGPKLGVRINTRGTSIHGKWDAALSLAGQGLDWRTLDLEGRFATLNWHGAMPLDLRDVLFQIQARGERVQLASLRLGQTDRLQGSGEVDLSSRQWRANVNLKDQPVPQWPYPVGIELAAAGDTTRADLKSLEVRSGRLHASAWGSYDPQRPQAVDAQLVVRRVPFEVSDPADRQIVAGGLHGEGRLVGSARPLDLRLQGKLTGQGVKVGERTIGDLQFEIAGRVDERSAQMRSSELQLLGGQWSVEGHYGFADRIARAQLEVAGLPLKQLDGLVEPAPKLEGLLSAEVRGEWNLAGAARPSVSGDWSLRDLSRGPVAVDLAAGRVAIQGDLLLLEDLVLRRREGVGQGSIQFNLRDRNTLISKLDVRDWPAELPAQRVEAKVSAKTGLAIDIAKRSATGAVLAEGSASYQDKPAVTFSVQSSLHGRRIDVARLTAQVLEGTVEGTGTVEVDQWFKSTAALRLNDVRISALAPWRPETEALQGRWSGAIALGPDNSPRPLEPMRIQLHLQPEEARYEALEFGQITGTFALGPQRLIIVESDLHLADGRVGLWGRLTRHGSEWFAQTQADFDRLSLAQLVNTAQAEAEEMVGRLQGRLTLFGDPRKPRQLGGELLVNISESDLANSDIVGAMYQAMSVQASTREPVGEGSARLRLQEGSLALRHAIYRNRGVEIRAAATVEDIFKGTQSPISGHAVGTARPLRDLRLPMARDLDEILSALQTTATTLRINGTIAQPRLRQATLADIGSEFKRALIGDAKSSNRE